MMNPASEITPIGLFNDEQTLVVFAVSLRQYTYGETHPPHLPGLAKTTSIYWW